jgi:hypothetical protein
MLIGAGNWVIFKKRIAYRHLNGSDLKAHIVFCGDSKGVCLVPLLRLYKWRN